MGSKLLAFLLMTSAAFGQAVCVTNRTHIGLPLGPLINPITSMQRGDELRHNNYAFDGSGPADLGASFVRYEIVSGPTMSISRTNVTYAATILGPGLTQVIITPSIPAGVYYTKFLQYQANNSNYLRTLSWDTLVVTSAPSAIGPINVSNTVIAGNIESGAVQIASIGLNVDLINIRSQSITNTGDMYIDGTLYAGGLIVTGAVEAIDNSKMPLNGGTFTNLPVTGAFFGVFSGMGGTLTGLNWNAISNAPTIPDLADVVTNRGATINGEPITNGAAITVSQSNVGDVQLYTNAYGKLFYTNASGEATLLGPVMPITGTVYHLSFESTNDLTLFTNLNYGAWSNRVYGSSLKVITPTESSDLARVAALPVTSTVMRFTAKILGHSAQQGSLNQQYGIAIGNGTSNSYQLRLRLTAGTRQLRGYQGALTSPGNAASGGTAQHPADPGVLATFEILNIEQFPVFLGLDFDGTNRVRGYIAACLENGMPAQWVQVSSKTNFNSLGWVGLVGSLAAGATYTNAVFGYDDVTYDEGVYLQ